MTASDVGLDLFGHPARHRQARAPSEAEGLIPACLSNCADCGVGTWGIGQYYMVRDELWEQAWAGHRKSWHGKIPGTEILCIECLESRIGRTITAADFTAVFPQTWPIVRRNPSGARAIMPGGQQQRVSRTYGQRFHAAS